MLLQINSAEAFQLLTEYVNPLLIDVRTPKEWHETGIPDMENIELIQLSMHNDNAYQKDFAMQLHNTITKLNESYKGKTKYDENSPLFFLCGAGLRSQIAANLMIEFGYHNCHNITDGCWGNNMNNGWIANNLPWKKN